MVGGLRFYLWVMLETQQNGATILVLALKKIKL